MATVKITVRERIAIVEAGIELVCNNPTDTIEFDFDEEWSAHNTKTARFSWDGRYIDVVFDGNTVKVPEIYKTSYVFVGVFSDGITTTPAKVPTRFSIKCHGGKIAEPRPDVYAQILEKLNACGGSGGGLPSGGEPHQMLTTDAEGNTKWEDRTHYTSIGMTEIIPETTLVFENGVTYLANPLPDAIKEGANIIVKYNGVEYPVTGIAFNMEGLDCIGFGNIGLVTGGDMTEEPFVFIKPPDELSAAEGVYAIVSDATGALVAYFSVKGEGEIVHKIDGKYLPNSVVRKVITINADDESNVKIDFAFAEAWEMSENELMASTIFRRNGDRCSVSAVAKFDATDTLGCLIIQFDCVIFDDSVYNTQSIKRITWALELQYGVARIAVENISLRDYKQIVHDICGQGLVNRQNQLCIEYGYGVGMYNNVLAIALQSTTPGSTKRFTITVDDSGTLTASELPY